MKHLSKIILTITILFIFSTNIAHAGVDTIAAASEDVEEEPTASPSPSPTAEPTPTPSPTPTVEPTATPTATPTPTPTITLMPTPENNGKAGTGKTIISMLLIFLLVLLIVAFVWVIIQYRDAKGHNRKYYKYMK